MIFDLDKEKALDVLIWWVEGSDGSIDYSEEQAVEDILENMDYSLETYYEETLQHIGALGTDELGQLVDEAIEYGSTHYDDHQKKVALALLHVIAESNGAITSGQQEKLDRIQTEFGVENPRRSDK